MKLIISTHYFFISILLFSTFLFNIEAKPELQKEKDRQEVANHGLSNCHHNGTESNSPFFQRIPPSPRQNMRTPTVRLTCDKFPRMCYTWGSPGPHCCKKKCVNVLTDKLNCGQCGKICKYSQVCCKGKCVNPSFHRSHCGGCNNRCQDGGFCAFGVCNYA